MISEHLTFLENDFNHFTEFQRCSTKATNDVRYNIQFLTSKEAKK